MPHYKYDRSDPIIVFKQGYRHNQAPSRKSLYFAIRERMKVSRRIMARYMGLTFEALRYRERTKQMYHASEIVGLYDLSKMDAESFMKLLREIA